MRVKRSLFQFPSRPYNSMDAHRSRIFFKGIRERRRRRRRRRRGERRRWWT